MSTFSARGAARNVVALVGLLSTGSCTKASPGPAASDPPRRDAASWPLASSGTSGSGTPAAPVAPIATRSSVPPPASASAASTASAASPVPWTIDATKLRLYPFAALYGELKPNEIGFRAEIIRSPGMGDELWVIGRDGPIGRGKVVRRYPMKDPGLCGAPSVEFVVRLELETKERTVVAVGPAGSWTPPPSARGYDNASLELPELASREFSQGADLNGDGTLDIAKTSSEAPCRGEPKPRKFPAPLTYQGAMSTGEYCVEHWARAPDNEMKIIERFTHGICAERD